MSEPPSLAELPAELLLHAFGGLDAVALARLRSTCRRLLPLASDRALWARQGDEIAAPAKRAPLFALAALRVKGAVEKNMEALGRYRALRIDRLKTADVSALGACHTVRIGGALSGFDPSGLRACHTVSLVGTRALFAPLGSCHRVELDGPSNLRLAGLAGCHTVVLRDAYWVDDVRPLAACHTVEIDGASRVTDVEPLRACHTVALEGARDLRDVSALGTCHTVALLGSFGCITSVAALWRCHTLHLGAYDHKRPHNRRTLADYGAGIALHRVNPGNPFA